MKRTHTRFPRKFISGLSLVLLISTFCGVLGHVWMTSAAGRRFATLVSQTIKSPFFGQQHSSGASKEVADTSYPTSPAILNVNPMTIERAAVSSAAPSFGTATNFGVGTSPVGVAVGDFNLDGQPDLAVANNSSSNVSVLLGNGAGSFGAATNFGAGTTCVGVAVGDFNLDGKPDLAVTNANFTGGTVSVLLGNGAGSFGAATSFAVGDAPRSVTVGDFNLDGKPDLAVANTNTNTVSVLLGNGAGSFGAATSFAVGNAPRSVAMGDFNLDGKADLVTANNSSSNLSVLLGNGAGSFGAATNFGVGTSPAWVTVGDFNLDGKPDLATANNAASSVSVLMGDGAGVFGAAASFSVGGGPQSVAVGDFNLDGKPDLAAPNFGSGTVSVLPGNGAGSFGTATIFGVGSVPPGVAVGDFNLDGKPDLAVTNQGSGNVSVLLNQTDQVPCTGTAFGTVANFSASSNPQSVAVGDFNLDGKPDLAVANNNISNIVSVLLGNGAGSFGAVATFGAGAQPCSVAVADFNLDGKPDLATANLASANVSVLLGNGAGSFGAATNFGAGTQPFAVAVGDFNLDGKPDLAVANNSSSNVSVLLGNGAGSFGAATNFGVSTNPRSVAVGDFNLDGKPDLAVANFFTNNVSVLLGNGAGSFGAATNFTVGTRPQSVAVGDFNQDGKPDLATANTSSANVSVLLGNGAGSFGAATNFTAATIPNSVAVGDFNRDGKADLAVANGGSNNVSVLLGNGAGSFGTASNFGVGTNPQVVTVGDFNLDGKPDLAAANNGSANTSVLLNTCSTCPTITGTVSGTTAICPAGSATVTVTVTGGAPPYTVTLTNGGGTQTGSSPLTFTVAPGATTTYTVQSGTDANSCTITGSGSATVTVDSLPGTPTITPTSASVCPSSSGNQASGPAGATSYAWTITNGTITSATNLQTITYTAGASGTVGLMLTVTNATGCAASNSANVTINTSGIFAVTNGNDSGAGSLRDTIANACPGSTITFSGVSTVTLTTAELLISKNITIDGGSGVTVTRSTAGGTPDFRIFNIASGSAVMLSGLTISNGKSNSEDLGGGIFNDGGTLTVNGCRIDSNIALDAQGGGVANNSGTVIINNSTISNNSAGLGGGGLSNLGLTGTATMTLTNCTISGNTVTDTMVTDTAGGVENGTSDQAANLTVLNCTIANNSTLNSINAGGLLSFVFGAGTTDIKIKNTIIAGNSDSQVLDEGSSFTSQGNNLIADNGDGVFTGAGDLLNTNPILAALSNYGGTTMTHALLPGSPAINAGTSSGAPTSDQRGKSRFGNVDIGAFESQGFTLAATGGGGQSTTVNTNFANPLTLTIAANNAADNEPVNGGNITFTAPGSGASCSFASNPATISSGAASSGTVTANGTAGSYNVTANATGAASSVSFALTNTPVNTPPTISSVILMRTAGAGSSNSTIANVSDGEQAANTLSVTVNGAASATLNGVTVAGLSISAGGVVTANVVAVNGAASGDFTLRVTDNQGETATATLVVIVTSPACSVGSFPVWKQQAKNTASDGTLNASFGGSVVISGDTAIVGAGGGTTSGTNAGSAYVFIRSAGVWTQQQILTASDGAAGDNFGSSVALSGDTAIVGAQLDDTSGGPSGANEGSAYVFTRSGSVWTQQQKLTASDSAARSFGVSVALSGDTAVIGAHEGTGAAAGSAYVFIRSGGAWTQQQQLTASDGAAGDSFGISVALSGDIAIVGAPFDDTASGTDAGSAYVFTRSGGVWAQQQKLTASDGAAEDLFGRSVTLSGDTALVGAVLDDTPSGANTGSAYIFTRSSGVWTQQQKLTAADASESFGASVALSGDTAIVGAHFTDTVGGTNAGAAYVFTRSGGVWIQQQKLTAADGAGGDFFGISVALSGDTAIVGAFQDDTPGVVDAGSSYIFNLTCNASPTITAQAGLGRQQGSPASNSTIATVNDVETAAGSLTVTVTSANPLNGVTVSNIQNTNGTITADIVASCTASNASFTLQVSDGSLTNTATLSISVTANTAPTVGTYAATAVALNGTMTVTPNAAPADNGTIASVTATASPNTFTGTFSGDTSTGAVTITNAAPAGVYTITVTVTDNCGATVVKTFALMVDMCAPAPSNLGLWYRAEGNANAFVGGVNASTATNSGQASPTSPMYTTGKVGQAWSFNGTTDALDSGATTILNTFPVTIEAWVNPALRNDAGTTNLSGMVYPNNTISNDKAGFYGHGFGVNVTPDGSQFTIEYNDGFRVVPQANASFSAGQWYHIVVVYGLTGNQGSFKAYVNGQLVDQLTYTQGIVDGLSLIRIGYHNDDNGYGTRRFFKGLLDEVSIYQGCALQLADIQALYQAGAAGKCLSPLNLNTPPTITAAGTLSRSRGSSSVSTIATVNDTETPAGNLTVAVQSAPTGITVSNIQNSNGTITATVAADCTATLGNNTVVLYVSDGACATPFANLIVNVTANTSPTLMYNSASVTVGGSTMITPMAGPSDNGSIASIVVQGVGAFTGTISVNSMTGAISVSSAAPVGMHTITIRATDNCLATTDTTFVLSVTCPTITLNPTSLSAGTVGTGYSQSVTASPAGTYSYGVTSGALPNGLTLNTSDGTISGTPTAAGTFNFRITAVLTGTGCSDFRDYSVVISCPTITLGALTGGTVGTSYNQSVAASPAGTYSYSVTSGLMPNGLSLNTSDGTVSGTPTAAGTFNFRITAVLTGTGCVNFRDYSVVISCPTITLGALTGGTVGTIYNQSVAASPAGTYSYSVTSGLVPNGLALNTSDGTVSGTPTAAGTFNFRITAVLTGTGCSNFRDYSVVIVCPTITLGSLSGVGTVGANYNQSAAASPAGTYSYGITSGALPNGLTLNLSNGTVSGTPTAAGTFNFRITATLTGSTCTGFSDYSIVVTCPTVTLNPTTLPGGSLGVGYNQSVTASPAGTYSYGVTSGALPNGLTLNLSNGAITGIPTVAGVFNFRITATMNGCVGFRDYSIVICPLMSSCPTNITTNAANGQCSAVVNYTPPTANAGCAGTTVACVPNSGSSFTVGTTTVTCTATDAFNNTASCSFTVQVNDNQSPVLGTCPANITNFPAANGSCAATVTFTPPTVNDNCAGAIVTCTPASGSSFALGTTTVTCSAKDAANNMSAACTFTVQVVDTTPPTLGACPANITGQSAGANCTAVVTYTNPTASDNCGTPTVTCTPASGSSFALGTTTVSCVAKDAANNMSAACTFTVQVLDTTPPTLGACPANITNQAAGANCTAAVTFTPPTATDNCGTPTVTCTPASGSSFALGTTTVSCVAKDAANNMSAACTFTVQVTDTTPPTLGACPANITNQSAGAACTAVVTYTNPTASDNCGTPTVTCSPASGSAFALGTTTVTCSAKDAANNMSAACTFTVQVVDTTPPTLGACPANITNVAAASGQCSAVVNFTRPTASDNCGTPTVTCAPASGSSFVVGTTTVSCVAKDSANNMSAACTFTVQVVDTQNPTISCPSNQNVGTSGSSAVVTYPAPTASDNCISVTTNCVPPSGSTFGLGTTTVTCTATDASLRTASCSFTVLVTNTCAGIVCPSNVFVGTTGNSTVVNYPAPSANGTCGAIICSPASGSVFNVGVTTVTCNSSIGNQSCSFNVTVNRVSGTASDPLICTGPGNTVQATLVITNNGNANQTVADTTSFTNLVGVPGTCTVTPNVGTCVVTNGGLTYNASLTPGQTVTITYLTQVGDLVQTGQQVCTNNSVTFNGGAPYVFSACGTANCPTQGPGNPFPAAAEGSDQKAGSVLIYNVFTSGATSGNTQNTRINITNTHGKLPAFVHLFFVAEGCSIADSYLCLTANQTASFLASDLDPGTTGYLVAVAVNALGCPTNFNSLIGDEYVKFTSGHAANLAAEAFAALPGGLPLCDGNSVTATLNFDGVSYNRLPAVLALSNIGSRADGNDTLLILNRIGGNLGIGASTLGTLFGVIYDDAENALSFNVAGSCQLRNSISNNFPRTTPRFESFIPAGRSGWLKLFSQTGTVGITGAAINFNANAGASAGAFNQGHNLHHLTLNNQMSYIIPVFPPSC